MTKNYTVSKSSTTGWWTWACNDGSNGGESSTKRGAKAAGAAACGSSYSVKPPSVGAQIDKGQLASMEVKNLDNQKVTFQSSEISEEAFMYFCGLTCFEPVKVSKAEKAITILKIWGLYRGGTDEKSIRKLHFLDEAQFDQLIARQYLGLKIVIEDDNTIQWFFPDLAAKE